MTSDERQQLRVDLGDWAANTAYAEYDDFTIGSAADKYRLASLGNFTGTAGKKLKKNVLHYFMTDLVSLCYLSATISLQSSVTVQTRFAFVYNTFPGRTHRRSVSSSAGSSLSSTAQNICSISEHPQLICIKDSLLLFQPKHLFTVKNTIKQINLSLMQPTRLDTLAASHRLPTTARLPSIPSRDPHQHSPGL